MSMQDRSRIEEAAQQLLVQLEELRNAIRVVQSRSIALSNEIREIRLAYETLSSIQRYGQKDTLASLDREGYVFVKIKLDDVDKAVIRITKDLYAVLPIDNVKNVLSSYEKDLVVELQETEAELKKLSDLYNQLQRKLQEYLATLSRSDRESTR
uniref:Prefoldin subunit alpha n=1 Tax=Ignisphaera aggregans TaxID=334771 RepID=A0A7C5TI34_9CREN